MWVKTENSEPIMPAMFEESGNIVIIRRRFKFVEASEDKPSHYEYEEWQMTEDQYSIYQTMEEQINEQNDALVELAELFTEQEDALVELAGIIDGGN